MQQPAARIVLVLHGLQHPKNTSPSGPTVGEAVLSPVTRAGAPVCGSRGRVLLFTCSVAVSNASR
jgi:hypothetical protein